VETLTAAATLLPRPHHLHPRIDGSPHALLVVPAVGGGGDLGLELGATEGP
jgi:hypothetical protein